MSETETAAASDSNLITKYRPTLFKQVLGQTAVVQSLQTVLKDQTAHGFIFTGPPGTGKALTLDTPIPSPDGWTTMGALEVGNRVYDMYGRPCHVTFATEVQTDRRCLKVVFSDGSWVVADEEHLWLTTTSYQREKKRPELQKVTTRDIRTTLLKNGRTNHAVPLCWPLLRPVVEQPIDPYLLGVWLGDGASKRSSISTRDPEILDAFRAAGYLVNFLPSKTIPTNCDYRISSSVGQGGAIGRDSFQTRLKALGVFGDKHVPEIYLRGSVEQRLALLQGLMDTDGTCSKSGYCQFYNMSERLADAVYELAISLGIKAIRWTKNAKLGSKDYGICQVVGFASPLPVFRLERKLSRQRLNVRATQFQRYIVDVRPVDSVPVRCIQVSSETRTYLAGEACIPTHNTTLGRIVAKKVGCAEQNIVEVDAATFTGVEAMRDLTANMTFRALGASPNRTYIIDECHMLSKGAWASLLHAVEEPPAHVYWVFCTTEPAKVNQAIRTRCAEFALRPVDADLIHAHLVEVANKEKFDTPDDVLYLLAEKCEGSPRQALKLLAQCRRAKTRRDAADLLSTVASESEVIDLCRAMAKGGLNWAKAMELVKPLSDLQGESVRIPVVAYFTKAALDAKSDQQAQRVMAILSCFADPYPQGAGVAQVVLSLGNLLLSA